MTDDIVDTLTAFQNLEDSPEWRRMNPTERLLATKLAEDRAMDDLLAKLETAKHGSNELNCNIHALLIGGEAQEFGAYDEWWFLVEGERQCLPVPYYTTSIDAAITLIPEGSRWALDNITTVPDGISVVEVVFDYETDGTVGAHGGHMNPALAICIAALKARNQP